MGGLGLRVEGVGLVAEWYPVALFRFYKNEQPQKGYPYYKMVTP